MHLRPKQQSLQEIRLANCRRALSAVIDLQSYSLGDFYKQYGDDSLPGWGKESLSVLLRHCVLYMHKIATFTRTLLTCLRPRETHKGCRGWDDPHHKTDHVQDRLGRCSSMATQIVRVNVAGFKQTVSPKACSIAFWIVQNVCGPTTTTGMQHKFVTKTVKYQIQQVPVSKMLAFGSQTNWVQIVGSVEKSSAQEAS